MPPELPLLNLRIGILEAEMLQLQNTAAVNFAGNSGAGPACADPWREDAGYEPSINRAAPG